MTHDSNNSSLSGSIGAESDSSSGAENMPALVYIGHQFRLRSPEPSDLNFIHGSDVSSDGSGSDNHSPHSTEIEFIGSDVSSGGSGGSGGNDIQILSGGGDDDKCDSDEDHMSTDGNPSDSPNPYLHAEINVEPGIINKVDNNPSTTKVTSGDDLKKLRNKMSIINNEINNFNKQKSEYCKGNDMRGYLNYLEKEVYVMKSRNQHLANLVTSLPTSLPTSAPTKVRACRFRMPMNDATNDPQPGPSYNPTIYPSNPPTNEPTHNPTNYPTNPPTNYPSNPPTRYAIKSQQMRPLYSNDHLNHYHYQQYNNNNGGGYIGGVRNHGPLL